MLFFNDGRLLAGILMIVDLDGLKVAFLKDKFVELLKNSPLLKLIC